MTKRKARTLAAGAVLLLYIVSLSVLLYGSLRESAMYFETYTESHYDTLRSILENSQEEDLNIALYENQSAFGGVDYPYMMGIFEPDGTLAAKTQSSLVFADKKENKRVFIPLDDYLTKDSYVRIGEFCGEQKTERLSVNCIWFSRTENGLIPREIKLRSDAPDVFKTSGWQSEYLSLVLSDEPYDDFIVGDAEILFFNSSPAGQKSDRVLKLEKTFRQEAENRKKHSFDPNSRYYSVEKQQLGYEDLIHINGKPYILFCVWAKNPVKAVLSFSEFTRNSVLFTVIFIILFAVVMTFTDWLYEKNRRLNESRYSFISAAAHELKTPLAIISAECECALDALPPEKQDPVLVSVYEEANRMNDKVKELLAYNRTLSKETSEKVTTDIYRIAQNELEKFSGRAKEKHITIMNRIPEGSFIKCNGLLIGSVLENFLSNAVQYAPENAVVTLTAEKKRKRTVFSVSNTGSHIREEDMPHIWEELYRGDKVRNSADPSSGLGLSICKTILAAQGFPYGVKNTDNGVSFFFSAKNAKNNVSHRAFSEKESGKRRKKRTPAEICAVLVLLSAAAAAAIFFGIPGVDFPVSPLVGWLLSDLPMITFCVSAFLLLFFLIFAKLNDKSPGRKRIIGAGLITAAAVLLLVGAFFLGLYTGVIQP